MGANLDKNLFLVSLGCSKNLVDSEVMLSKLQDYSIVDNPEVADVLIVNTCGFIGDAKIESIDTIFELNELRKEGSVLVVTGCLSERYKDELKEEMPEVDIFSGVGDYDKILEMVESKKSIFSSGSFLIDKEDRIISNSNYHAYIKISEGCNQACSFCAIPNFRGKLKSRSIESIVTEVKKFVDRGYRDFSFISQDSSSYLRDKGVKDGLIHLIEEIENIDGIDGARILYLYPTTTSIELIEKIKSSKVFYSYFDMPIQHISDTVLKAMRRGANKERHLELLEAMKGEDSFIRTTIIAGHPGEDEKSFLELKEFLEEFKFDRVNIFSYFDEEGTPAYLMDNKIDENTTQRRVDELGEAIKEGHESSLGRLVGEEIEAIIEGVSSEHEFFYGARALNWAHGVDGEILINECLSEIEFDKKYVIKITDIAGENLIARAIKQCL